jgi:hypothetical protein
VTSPVDLAEKRARLVAAADLERLKLGLALRDVRHAIMPQVDITRGSRLRPYLVRAIGYVLPILGIRRVGWTLRIAGAAIGIWRLSRAWRGSRPR